MESDKLEYHYKTTRAFNENYLNFPYTQKFAYI
jgi:hypothetical protein